MTSRAPLHTVEVDDVKLLQRASQVGQAMRQNIGAAVIGQQEVVNALLAAVFAQGHVLIVGVPGLAKTLLVKAIAQVLGWSFRRIQFTPDMMPSDITGMELLQIDPASGKREMVFAPGPIFANLILGDEINRAPPKTQSALLEAMAEYHVTSLGKTHAIEQPFVVVATQNPIEQEGTYPLPEAQLDRFMFSLWIDYPTRTEEEEVVMQSGALTHTQVQPVVSLAEMRQLHSLVQRLPVSRPLVNFAVKLARATRPADPEALPLAKRFVEWGAGPRASQHIIAAAKAMAVLEQEPTVSVGHIVRVAPYVLRHRVILNHRAAGEGKSSMDVIRQVIEECELPTAKRG